MPPRNTPRSIGEEIENESSIVDFVNTPIPTDWLKWSLDKRRDYWAGACKGQDIPTMPRDRICPLEVWRELLNGGPNFPAKDRQNIKKVLQRLPEWKIPESPMRYGKPYGSQRGFKRKDM